MTFSRTRPPERHSSRRRSGGRTRGPGPGILVLVSVLAGCPESDGAADDAACPDACATCWPPPDAETTSEADVPFTDDVPSAEDALPDADAETDVDAVSGSGLRLMTYNIRAGLESGLAELAAAILAERPDFIALQEVDNEADRSGNINQSYRLGQLTGMASLFRSAFDFSGGGSYGLAVLSRYPILTSDKLNLTSSGEQRILAVVTVELEPGVELTLAVTHLDLDAATREIQADEIVARLASEPRVVLFGDLNEEPDGPALMDGLRVRRIFCTLRSAQAPAERWRRNDDGTGPPAGARREVR